MNKAILAVTALAVSSIGLSQGTHQMEMARYGGPSYLGKPALEVTASFIKAGGGTSNFSTAKAFTAMLGEATVKSEVAKLTKQYGAKRVQRWLEIFDFAVADAIKIATAAKVSLPKGTLSGAELAKTMVQSAMDKDGTIYVELLFDKALSHDIHERVMDNIDKKFSPEEDMDFHRICNQALYDIAVALKIKNAKLARLH